MRSHHTLWEGENVLLDTATNTSVWGMRCRARMRVGKQRYATESSLVLVAAEDRTRTAIEEKHFDVVDF